MQYYGIISFWALVLIAIVFTAGSITKYKDKPPYKTRAIIANVKNFDKNLVGSKVILCPSNGKVVIYKDNVFLTSVIDEDLYLWMVTNEAKLTAKIKAFSGEKILLLL